MSHVEPRTHGASDSPWILRPSPKPHARLRLFCLPHAGGDTWIYRDWQKALPSFVEICAIRLPGRGSRMADPPITEFTSLVPALADAMRDMLAEPFAIYGNSMGALLAFELTRHLRRTAGVSPAMLCVGSCRAPQLAYFPALSNLTPHMMLQEIEQRYGMPMRDIASNEDLMQLTLPILRSDMELCESYRYRDADPLECPITAYSGTRDATLDDEMMDAWAVQTSGVFVRHEIIGDHFFVVGSQAAFLRILTQDLEWAMG